MKIDILAHSHSIYRPYPASGGRMISCSHWGMFPIPDTTYQRLNFGPELS